MFVSIPLKNVHLAVLLVEKDCNVSDQLKDASNCDSRKSLDAVVGSNLVGNSGLVVPQYRLLREDRPFNDDEVDYESRSVMQKLEKMQRRRQARKQKQTVGLSTADNVPGFRGEESIDKLIDYIDASDSTPKAKGNNTKQNKKKKTGKNSSSKSNEKVVDAERNLVDKVATEHEMTIDSTNCTLSSEGSSNRLESVTLNSDASLQDRITSLSILNGNDVVDSKLAAYKTCKLENRASLPENGYGDDQLEDQCGTKTCNDGVGCVLPAATLCDSNGIQTCGRCSNHMECSSVIARQVLNNPEQLCVLNKSESEVTFDTVNSNLIKIALTTANSSSLPLSGDIDIVSDICVISSSGKLMIDTVNGNQEKPRSSELDIEHPDVDTSDKSHFNEDSFVTVQRRKRTKNSNVSDVNTEHRISERSMETTEQRRQNGTKQQSTSVTCLSVSDTANSISELTGRPSKPYSASCQRSVADRRSVSTVSVNTILSQPRSLKSNHAFEGTYKSHNADYQVSRAPAKGPVHRTNLVEKTAWSTERLSDNNDDSQCTELTVDKEIGDKIRLDNNTLSHGYQLDKIRLDSTTSLVGYRHIVQSSEMCGDEVRFVNSALSHPCEVVEKNGEISSSVALAGLRSTDVNINSSTDARSPSVVTDKTTSACNSAYITDTASSSTSCSTVCITVNSNFEQLSQSQSMCSIPRQVLSDANLSDAVDIKSSYLGITDSSNSCMLNSTSVETNVQSTLSSMSSSCDQSETICNDHMQSDTAYVLDSRSVCKRPNQSVVFLDTQHLEDSTPIRSDISFGFDPEIPTLPQTVLGGVAEVTHNLIAHQAPVIAPLLHYIPRCPTIVYIPSFPVLPPVPFLPLGRRTPVGVVPPMPSEVCQADLSPIHSQNYIKATASNDPPASSLFDLFSAQRFMHSGMLQVYLIVFII